MKGSKHKFLWAYGLLGTRHLQTPSAWAWILGSISIFVLASLSFSSCGDSEKINTECKISPQSSCVADSGGASVSVKLSGAQPGEEYVFVILSRDEAKLGDRTKLRIQTHFKPASDAFDPKELQDIKRVKDHRYYGQGTNSAAGGFFQESQPSSFNNDSVSPLNLPNQEQIFIPDANSFLPKIDENQVQVPPSPGENPKGIPVDVQLFDTKKDYFDLLYDTSRFNAKAETPMDSLRAIYECLEKELPSTMDYLGKPRFHLNHESEIHIVITPLQTTGTSATVGLFYPEDRLLTRGKNALKNSNHGEYIYITTGLSADVTCSASDHEYQHFYSFENKVLARMPAHNRFDLQEQINRHLEPEKPGLNEGYSHIIEGLSGKFQRVGLNDYAFFTDPQLATFDLQSTWNSAYDNSRSRGLNTTFLYYAIARAGGTLYKSDEITHHLLKSLIESPDRGFDNIAKYFHTSTSELLKDFFTKLILAMFDASKVHELLPDQVVENKVPRGLKLMRRDDPLEKIPYASDFAIVHPYQFDLPPAAEQENFQVSPGGLVLLRYKVPNSGKPLEAEFTGGGKGFSVYTVRYR